MISKQAHIAVLCGGISQEREVSLRSGKNVYEALQRLGYSASLVDPATTAIKDLNCDIAFLALHGPRYEDGTLQAELELYSIPYTGNTVATSVVTMDKSLTKAACERFNVPSAKHVLLTAACEAVPSGFEFPLILKPLNEGSSIDVYVCDSLAELAQLSASLVSKYGEFLLEEFIEGKELTVGVIQCPDVTVLPILELRPKNRFYDYDAKYTAGKTEFILPATLNESETKAVQVLSASLFERFQCRGMARFDYRFCNKRGPFLLEVNTIPGLTDTSDLPAQAKEHGYSFDELIDIILQSASR